MFHIRVIVQHVARPLKARFWATGDLVVSVEAYKSHFHPRHRRSVSQYVCASVAQASTAPVVRVVTVRNRNNVNVSTTQKFEYYSNYTNEKPQFEHYVQINYFIPMILYLFNPYGFSNDLVFKVRRYARMII